MSVVMALDPSLRTGWCAGEPGSRPVSGVLDISAIRDSSKRFYAFGTRLNGLIQTHGVTALGFEQPVYGQGRNSKDNRIVQKAYKKDRLIFGIDGVIEFICMNNGISPKEVEIGTWRKHFYSHGGYTRADAKRAALTRARQLGLYKPGMTDDEAEAIGIWDYLCSLRSPLHAANFTPIGQAGGW